MRTLVTFLGRTARPDYGYPTVAYRFPDDRVETTAFVGDSLRRYEGPERFVVMGTAGSAWDQLLDQEAMDGLDDTVVEQLMVAVQAGTVAQDQLDAVVGALAEARDCSVVLVVVPDGFDSDGQVALLDRLARVTAGSDVVSLDVTHGYRHMPMVVVMAALYLRELRPELRIDHLWYAALDPGGTSGAVHDVTGLLHIADWLSALQRSELTGDYRGIARLIGDDELAADLARGGFLEAIHQGQQAKANFQRVRQRLSNQSLPGAGALFQPTLMARTEWVTRERLYERQRDNARGALQRGDFLRAALYGFEAFISKCVQAQGGKPGAIDRRQAVKQDYEANGPANAEWSSYKTLRDLRNVLAHGNRPQIAVVQRALHDPESLEALLTETLDALLGDKR